ncbi:MAG: M56 family metallopeptidase, partial [Anaerotignum sp.]
TVPIPVETIAEMHMLQDLPVEAEHNASEIILDIFLSFPELVWMMGVVLFLVWQGWKYAGFRRMLKRSRRKVLDASVLDTYYTLCRSMGMKKRPELYFCGGLPSPLCVGFWKQEIYINSEDREEGDIRLILKHELTHCQRKDLWFKGVLMLARAMHFFNPFVHWMAKLAEKDMELSCDLAVMENCGMAEREAYSMAILRTVKETKSKNMQMSTAFSGGKEELKARFENIFDMTAKKRGIALFVAAALVVCGGTAFVGCAVPEVEEETLTGVVYGDYTEEIVHQLYEAKLQYIGDHVGVGKILGLLPMPDGVTNNSEGMELFTAEEPCGARRNLDWEETAETTMEYDGEKYMEHRWYQIHGLIFLALVDNADYLEYAIHQEQPWEKSEGVVISTHRVDRDGARRYFGDKDLREFAADEETFRNFVFAINRYFYEGITTPEEIYNLMQLDDEAAQKRMNDMLSGVPVAEEDQSMSYQMILADSLVDEIAGQKLASSNPLDYIINCQQYDELVKIGEPALREFLSDFAEGNVGDTLEGYIMMFACQDILGEPRQTDLQPTEWYQCYAALDSTLCAPFSYDPMFYTADMEKEYGLDGSAVKKWSVVAAGQDERLQAVYAALDARCNEDMTVGHKVTFYAPLVQEIAEKGNSMSVFAVIFDNSYTMIRTKSGGYALFERGGSVIPSRLDFEKRGGKWVLTKWTQAQDGSDYEDSIKKMCDGNTSLARQMVSYDSEACQMLLWQNI